MKLILYSALLISAHFSFTQTIQKIDKGIFKVLTNSVVNIDDLAFYNSVYINNDEFNDFDHEWYKKQFPKFYKILESDSIWTLIT